MNKRIKKKKARAKVDRFAKELKKTTPGIKVININSYPNGDFYSDFKYKDMIIHYDSLYSPEKVLFEFDELLDKWRDWRVYHAIDINKDLKITSKDVKKVIDVIYSNHTEHYVNSLIRKQFADIDNLRTELDLCPNEYYKKHITDRLNYRLEKLNEHQEDLMYLRSLDDSIAKIELQDGYYTITFYTEPSQEKVDKFFKEASKIKGCLDYNYYYLK